ncbi:YciK family oxidoreductase [Pleionea sp. CnH1-48]|uniref:YciK family oxidoreductase n=1 Tax=Pleionea sp. CnH1-48 TaxID=2954494 RepID=UPI002096CE25|nr:YciK family oxidoreductase [Pleionea sp. CnH1-48]MCO7223860.1 YciK family oxidoreductase [Pleionea sp. CnH1-48]
MIENYQAADDLLKDKVILITGAGDGIGKSAALTYAKHGATVILLGRTTEKLEQVYDEIEAQGGPQPAIIPVNLLNLSIEQAQQIGEKILSEFGRLDGLLHNASQLGQLSPIDSYNDEHWLNIMQVNVNATFFLTKALLPALRQSPAASVIFTSSGVGNKGRAFWGAYSVSKFATEGFAQVLADELEKSNIRVNTINPGATRTKMRAKAYPVEDPMTVKTPAEIMPLYLYLMGADSAEVHGQRIDA